MRTLKILIIASVLTWSYAAYGQEIKVDFDKSMDFAKYKTFAWSEGMTPRNPIILEMIVSTIETELGSRGLVKSDNSPDLSITLIPAIGVDLQGVGPSWNNETYRFYGGRGNPAALVNIATGTLIVDLIDVKAGRNVWRGTATDTLPHSPSADPAADAKDFERTIKKAVAKMIKKYPVK